MFARAERDRRFDQLGQAAQRIRRAAGGVDHRREILGDALFQRRQDEIRLGGKPAVEGSFADAGPASDRLHRGVRAQLAVDLARRAQYALDVARRVRPQRPVLHRGHRDSVTDS